MDAALARALARLEAPAGDPAPRARPPVHVLYGGAHLFSARTFARVDELAREAFRAYAGTPEALAEAFALDGLDEAGIGAVHRRLAARLDRGALEAYRIDFEDGYGARGPAEEREHAAKAGAALGERTSRVDVGVRVKSLGDPATRERALETLEVFLAALASSKAPPASLRVVLPKVGAAREVEVLAEAVLHLRSALGLSTTLGLELMVETPAALFGPDGRLALDGLVHAGGGLVRALHLGPYDLLGAHGVGFGLRLDHPLADVARALLLGAAARCGVDAADGPYTELPVPPHRGEGLGAAAQGENRRAVHAAWRGHQQAVRRSLDLGFPTGWDLHPAQLVSRHLTHFALVRALAPAQGERLRNFLGQAARATRVGAVFDDAATGRGLVRFFQGAVAADALELAEAAALSGLEAAELSGAGFEAIVARRAAQSS